MAILRVIPVSADLCQGATASLRKMAPIAFLLPLISLRAWALKKTPAGEEPSLRLFIAHVGMNSVVGYLAPLNGSALHAARAFA